MLVVGSTEDLALIRSGGAQQPLKIQTGDHVLKLAVAIVALDLRVIGIIARRQKDRRYLDVYLLWFLLKIYGGILTDCFANATFLLLKVKAVFIDIRDQGNGLREVYMDGFIRGQVLVVRIGDHDRAVFHTGRTTRAFVLYNVSGLLNQGDRKVSCFAFHTVHFRVAQNLYVGVPVDLDQFGRKDSHGAVVGGIGLVELGHVAADGRRSLDKVDLKPGRGKIKRGLNPADPATHNHHVSKITVPGTFGKLPNPFF